MSTYKSSHEKKKKKNPNISPQSRRYASLAEIRRVPERVDDLSSERSFALDKQNLPEEFKKTTLERRGFPVGLQGRMNNFRNSISRIRLLRSIQ